MFVHKEGRTIFTGVKPEDFAPFAIMTVRDALNFTTDPTDHIGALTISQGDVRDEGTTKEYIYCGYPAVGELRGAPGTD